MRSTSPFLAAAALVVAAACGVQEPHLSFVGIAVHDSAHFEVNAPTDAGELRALTARFVWRDADDQVVVDRLVELTPDSGGYHRVISPAAAPDIVARSVPQGASQVEAVLRSIRYEDGGEWMAKR